MTRGMRSVMQVLLVCASCVPFLAVMPGVLDAHSAQDRADRRRDAKPTQVAAELPSTRTIFGPPMQSSYLNLER